MGLNGVGGHLQRLVPERRFGHQTRGQPGQGVLGRRRRHHVGPLFAGYRRPSSEPGPVLMCISTGIARTPTAQRQAERLLSCCRVSSGPGEASHTAARVAPRSRTPDRTPGPLLAARNSTPARAPVQPACRPEVLGTVTVRAQPRRHISVQPGRNRPPCPRRRSAIIAPACRRGLLPGSSIEAAGGQHARQESTAVRPPRRVGGWQDPKIQVTVGTNGLRRVPVAGRMPAGAESVFS